MQDEEWVTMREAAQRLRLSKSTISRIVSRNGVSTRPDTIDKRILLVDYNQLHRLVISSVKYKE